MSESEILLIGAGGHTHACIDVIEQDGRYKIVGLVGLSEELHSKQMGYSVIATDHELVQLADQYKYALITVGQIQSAALRIKLYQQTFSLGFRFPTFIAPSAYVSRHAVVGAGSIVMPGAIINAGGRVGENCIINSRALIEHDASIADHSHIATGVIVNGAASIGTGSFIGSGSIIKQAIAIGSNCVIGMGLAVRHNQADNTRLLSNEKT